MEIVTRINCHPNMSTTSNTEHKASHRQNVHGLAVLGYNVAVSSLHDVHLFDFVNIVIPYIFV